MRRVISSILAFVLATAPALAAAPAIPPSPTTIVVGSTPLLGSCLNGYFLFNNAGVPGCSAGSGASMSIGGAISGSPTAGYGLYVSGSSLGQFAYGTGVFTALGVNVGSAGAPVLFNGAGGTPSSLTLTNGTGLPVSTGVSGLGAGVATALGVAPLSTGSFTPQNGAITNGDCLKWSTTLGVTDAGAACGSGGGVALPQTVSGTVTSGGVPYFNSTTQMSTSALLAANALMVGGGAGTAPSTVTTGSGVVTALGIAPGTTGSFTTQGGAITTGNCLKWGPGVQDAGSTCGGGGGTLTANSTATSGFSAGQLLMSNGTTLAVAGAANATSLALGGATIGADALGVTGTSTFSGTINGNAISLTGYFLSTAPHAIYNRNSVAVMTFGGGDENLFGVEGTNQMYLQAGTSGMSFRVYNTYSSAGTNYERGIFDWQTTANTLTIGTTNGGTGLARNLQFVVGGTNYLDYGVTNSGAWTAAVPMISKGVTTGSNASAGYVGEIISSSIASGSAVSQPTSGTAINITSVSLTAGDWDCEATTLTKPAGTTTTSLFLSGMSTTTITLPTPPAGGYAQSISAATAGVSTALANTRQQYSVSTTTTVYLVGNATFAISTMGLYGQINCRRVR